MSIIFYENYKNYKKTRFPAAAGGENLVFAAFFTFSQSYTQKSLQFRQKE